MLLSGLFKPLLVIAIILFVHELGHIIFIKIFKIDILNIKIYPFGVISSMYKELNSDINHDIIIYFGGLLFQIILYFIVEIIYSYCIINTQLYNLFITYNYTIFIFNLLSIVPLDGYYILFSMFNKFIPYKITYYLSILISIIFVILFYLYNPKGSILVIFLLIYKIITEYKNIKLYYNKFCLERYLNKYLFKKIKIISNVNNLYRERNHYIITNGNILSEEKVLTDKFS